MLRELKISDSVIASRTYARMYVFKALIWMRQLHDFFDHDSYHKGCIFKPSIS